MGRRKKSLIPGFSLNRVLGITTAKQKLARATGIPTTKQGRKRKLQSHLWTAAAVGVAAACSSASDSPGVSSGDGGAPPRRKPFYKKWWFWLLVIILASSLSSRLPEISRAANQREAERIRAEQIKDDPPITTTVSPEDDGYTEEEQAAAAKEYYEKIGYDPTQDISPADAPDDGLTYLVPSGSGASPDRDVPPVSASDGPAEDSAEEYTYVLNTNTHKFHFSGCTSIKDINPENYSTYTGSRDSVISMGYQPCGRCNP